MKIIVIGETCEDIFIYGDVTKICPEAPVPVFVPKQVVKNNGMATNVLNNIKSLSLKCVLRGIHQYTPIFKTRFIDDKSNQMLLRIDEGESQILPLELDNEVLSVIDESDIVIVSDYNKGFLTDKILYEIAQKSKMSFIDTKRHLTEKIIKSFDFIKVNEQEFSRNEKLLRKYDTKVVVTLGKKGAFYMNQYFNVKEPKDTIDVSGAGDTFLASFVVKYIETANVIESINFANDMSSIVVSKRGVTTPFEIIENVENTNTSEISDITDINTYDELT